MLFAAPTREHDVVVEHKAEGRPQSKTDDVGGDIVRERRMEPEDVVGEQQAELGNADAAEIRKEKEEGFASRIFLGTPAVGPQAVHHPRVEGRGDRSTGVCRVRVSPQKLTGTVLQEVKQSRVDDERGRTNEPELHEFRDPCANFVHHCGGCARVFLRHKVRF